MTTFLKTNGGDYIKKEDAVLGYDNDKTYFFTDDEIKKYFGTPKKLVEACSDWETMEKAEEAHCFSAEDHTIRGTVWEPFDDVEEEVWFWQDGMIEPEYTTQKEFFESYPNESIWIGDNKNGYSGYEPEVIGSMENGSIDLEFVEHPSDLTTCYGVVIEYMQLWKDENGKEYILTASNSNYQESKTWYHIEEA